MRRLRDNAPSRSEQGMTLVEMMVVIVIIGVLTGLALILLRGRPGLQETSHQMANHIREASRKAVSSGIVDTNLVDATPPSPVPVPGARTRMVVEWDSTAQRQRIAVEVLDETQDPDVWFETSAHWLREGIVVHGYSDQLFITAADIGDAYGSGSGTGTETPTTLTNVAGTGAENFTAIYFSPDGSVASRAGDPVSFFLLDTSKQEKRMRVVTLPLQGQPLVFSGW